MKSEQSCLLMKKVAELDLMFCDKILVVFLSLRLGDKRTIKLLGWGGKLDLMVHLKKGLPLLS